MAAQTTDARVSLKETIRLALETIVDPCSQAMGAPAGLVSLGLVKEIVIENRPGRQAKVRVTLCITEPGCLMAAVFQETARQKLSSLPGVDKADVLVDHGHVWDREQMEPEYRRRLERLRAERLARMASRRSNSAN
jgi:metal-sulfur cluster biosynthetic enzyme